MARSRALDGPTEEFGELQRLVEALFAQARKVARIDVLCAVESFDLGPLSTEIARSLPPGSYTRAQLTTQLNSSITAHGWSRSIGLLE